MLYGLTLSDRQKKEPTEEKPSRTSPSGN